MIASEDIAVIVADLVIRVAAHDADIAALRSTVNRTIVILSEMQLKQIEVDKKLEAIDSKLSELKQLLLEVARKAA